MKLLLYLLAYLVTIEIFTYVRFKRLKYQREIYNNMKYSAFLRRAYVYNYYNRFSILVLTLLLLGYVIIN